MLARLFCLVDTSDDLSLLPALVDAGVDGFQVRAKAATTRELLELTARALATGAMVVVNDRLDVALASGAHGVHLGADDLPVAAARRWAPDLLIGTTCRSAAQVRRAADDGADYAGFGPIFATSSKPGLPEPLGTSAIGAATGSVPLVVIGGITPDRAAAVLDAGAYGLAVIGGIWRQPDPVLAAKEIAHSLR